MLVDALKRDPAIARGRWGLEPDRRAALSVVFNVPPVPTVSSHGVDWDVGPRAARLHISQTRGTATAVGSATYRTLGSASASSSEQPHTQRARVFS